MWLAALILTPVLVVGAGFGIYKTIDYSIDHYQVQEGAKCMSPDEYQKYLDDKQRAMYQEQQKKAQGE